MQHPDTHEATLTVAVPDCVMYLRTQAAAEAIGQTWRRATVEALHLPRDTGAFQPPYRPHSAEASVVVHTHGRPPGFVRLNRVPGTTTYLHVQLGSVAFLFHDKASFESVAGEFLRAAELGAKHLPEVDMRQAAPNRHQQPGLAGASARGAQEHLERVAEHQVPDASSWAQLEARLADVVSPLHAALDRVRALRRGDRQEERADRVERWPLDASRSTSDRQPATAPGVTAAQRASASLRPSAGHSPPAPPRNVPPSPRPRSDSERAARLLPTQPPQRGGRSR